MLKPDIGSDHDMVSMTFRARLSTRKKKSGRAFFDLEKLKDEAVAEKFKADLAGRFALLVLLDSGPQELCDEFTRTMEEVAKENLGRAQRLKKERITSEVVACCEDRRKKKSQRNLGASN